MLLGRKLHSFTMLIKQMCSLQSTSDIELELLPAGKRRESKGRLRKSRKTWSHGKMSYRTFFGDPKATMSPSVFSISGSRV